MKRTLTLFAAIVLLAVGAAAQKLSYQAVVRNSANELVYDASVTVALSILDANNTVQYSETQQAVTNQNGLLSLIIGEAGNPTSGSLAGINWNGASIKTEITLPTNEVIVNVMPVTAVPYALYAEGASSGVDQVQSDWAETDAESKAYILNKPVLFSGSYSDLTDKPNLAAVATTGNYNDLTNLPQIPQIPANISAFTNDVGYLTSYTESDPTVPAWAKAASKPVYNYNEIEGTPTIPTVPTNVSVFTNDAGYITGYTESDPTVPAWAKAASKPVYNYSEIVGTPTIPTVPTTISVFDNDAHYITINEVPAQVQSDWTETDVTSKSYIKHKPVIPTVPTNVSAFVNDAGYLTAANVQEAANIPTNVSAFNNDAGYLTSYTESDPTVPAWAKATSKPVYNYSEIVGTPTIPTVPTTISVFDNDAHYITINEVPAQVQSDWTETDAESKAYILNKPVLFSGSYSDLTDKPNLAAVATTGNYNDLTNLPQIPQIPANISAFTNDVGYLTSYIESDPTVPAWAKATSKPVYNYSEIVGTPTIPTVPTTISVFDNDAHYITINEVPAQVQSDWTETDAESKSYIRNKPAIPAAAHDATLTIQRNGTPVGTFTADASTDKTINVSVPTTTSELVNNSGFITQTALDNLASYYQQQLAGIAAGFQHLLDSLGGVVSDQQAAIDAQQAVIDSLRNSGGGTMPVTNPTLTTAAATGVTATSATLNGTITNPDNVTVTAQGFEWKATTGGTYTQVNAMGETMAYSLTGLTANTSYTYRAFVTTANGTSYGAEVTFTTLSAGGTAVIDSKSCPEAQTVTDHEGNVYATVQIGNQCWMRDNLRTTTSPSTGTYLIPAADADYTYTGKQARWYNNDSATYAPMNYGLLYNWNAAVDTFNTAYGETSVNSNSSYAVSVTFTGHRRGICPAGWHLPSDAEWTTLTDYVSSQSEFQCGGNSNYIAKALASTEGWNSYSSNCVVGNDPSTNNATGFSAVPAGNYFHGWFVNAGYFAYFWSSTQVNRLAYNRDLYCSYANVGRGSDYKDYGFSVRCLRDEEAAAAQEQPTLTTAAATGVTATSATLNGSVANPGNVDITARGFEWKTTEGGTYAQVTASGSEMTYNLTGLTANTSYTYCAFVTTANGTSYGAEVTFTTLSAGGTAVIDEKSCPEAQTVTDHEGNVYATVQIGNQCWMRDNLRTTTSPSTGTYLIPAAGTGYTYTGKQAFWYNNNSAACAPMNYGLLYNWNAAVDTFNTTYGETSVNTSSSNAVSVTFNGHRRGICPAGWHLPSDAEWTTLTDYVSSQSEFQCGGNSNYIAKALASTEGWNTYTNNCAVGNDPSTNNATGFSAVPAGTCRGSFSNAGVYAYFWSSTRNGSLNAYYRNLYYGDANVVRYYNNKANGFSVRCLRD